VLYTGSLVLIVFAQRQRSNSKKTMNGLITRKTNKEISTTYIIVLSFLC
jgi:hypothetical protein